MHEEALRRQADEKRRAERKQRHMQDDLRYAIKKLPDPIDVNMDYEEVHFPDDFLAFPLVLTYRLIDRPFHS